MKIRVLNLLLLVASIVGGVLWLSSASSLHSLRAEYNRVVAHAGELEVKDPSLLHVQAIKTDDPWQFAWRVYVPANFSSRITQQAGGGRGESSFSTSEANEFIARIRLGKSRDGQIAIYRSFGPTSSFSTCGSSELYDFLQEHFDEIQIEQLGDQGTCTMKPLAPATLLRLSLPSRLAEEARKKFKSSDASDMFPVLYECRIGEKP